MPFFVVGLAVSPGDANALEEFVAGLPEEPEFALVVVQQPGSESGASPLDRLRDGSDLEVERASSGARPTPGRILVVPPGELALFRDGALEVLSAGDAESPADPTDSFFASLADAFEGRTIGVVLSSRGSAGRTGLRAVRAKGGLAMLGREESTDSRSSLCRHIERDGADWILAPRTLAERIAAIAGRSSNPGGEGSSGADLVEDAQALDRILEIVGREIGTDVSRFRSAFLFRHVERRSRIRGIEGLEHYLELLESRPEEAEALFRGLMLKSPALFAPRRTWERYSERFVPALLDDRSNGDQLRAWIPGCSTGEDAYSLGMIWTGDADSAGHVPEIKIFATDLDARAVECARDREFSDDAAANVPERYLRGYTSAVENGFTVDPAVRRKLLFGVQDVLSDPPFAELDFVCCRNLLENFDEEARHQLLRRLHYGLRPGGCLMVGSPETLEAAPDLFERRDPDHPLFRARPGSSSGVVVELPTAEFPQPEGEAEPPAEGGGDLAALHRNELLREYTPASVLVDERHRLLRSEGPVDEHLSIPEGRPNEDVLEMLPSRLRAPARSALSEAFRNEGETVRRHVPADTDAPVPETVLRARELQAPGFDRRIVRLDLRRADDRETDRTTAVDAGKRVQKLESLVAELRERLGETRKRLQSTADDHQETNRELHAANLELTALNEELQSKTEELETSREELQAMNEELSSVNRELHGKIRQLDAINTDLQNLLRSTEIGTIFLNRDLEIERFTDAVREFVPLIDSDVGRPLEEIRHSLATDDLVETARRVLDEEERVEWEVSTEEGDTYLLLRAIPYVTLEGEVDGVVLTFLDITRRRRIEQQLAASERKFRTVFEITANPIFVYELESADAPGGFTEVNDRAIAETGFEAEELSEMTICDLLDGGAFDCRAHLRDLVVHGRASGEAKMQLAGDEAVPCEFHARRETLGDTEIVVEIVRNISEREHRRQTLVDSRERAEELARLRSMFLSTLSHDVRTPLSGVVATTRVLERKVGEEELPEVRRIERAIDQLREILDSVLRMARLETNQVVAEPEDFDLVERVRNVLDVHRARVERKGLRLESELPDRSVDVHLDSSFVTQIVNNLVENAVKYTEEGAITIGVAELDEAVEIEVADTGVGIDEEQRRRIFDRFETSTSGEYGSVGLGLAITDLLVDAMKGSIEVDSTPGEGSRFVVTLPRRLARSEEGDGAS